MDYQLQVITLSVSDVDKAMAFYTQQAGFTLDVDYHPASGFRVVQLTPPGSPCSVQIGIGLTDASQGRGIVLHLGLQCTKVEDSGPELTVHLGDGQSVGADLMLVATGRGPLVEGLGLERAGVEYNPRTGIATDERRRTSIPHIYAVGDCAGYWQLAHTAFREGASLSVIAGRACLRAFADLAPGRMRVHHRERPVSAN
jgi:NADH dehydrogenase FAD-containing subunit